MWSMLKYFISILCLALSIPAFAQDDMDDDEPAKPVVKVDSLHQLRFEADIFKPILYASSGQRSEYSLSADYYWKKDMYWVLEGGWGNAEVRYTDLSYDTRSTFFRAGFNKSLLARLAKSDWDMAFIGLRYGVAPTKRSAGTYVVSDPFFASTTGTFEARNFTAHWFEITGGVRVAVVQNFFLGWNIRGKFRLNNKQFSSDLPPIYIAGYGKGDRNSIFDFNFYLAYAIRWKK